MGTAELRVALFWLFAVFTVTSTNNFVDLEVNALLPERYNTSTTLNCHISSEMDLGNINIRWSKVENKSILCEYTTAGGVVPQATCTFSDRQLSLTIPHVVPSDEGRYICKFKSKAGMKYADTTVTLPDQYENVQLEKSLPNLTCSFYGVNRAGEVHWFTGNTNLTTSEVTSYSQLTKEGLFNIIGTHNTEDSREPTYTCALWIYRTGAYLTNETIHFPSEVRTVPTGSAGTAEMAPLLLLYTLFSIACYSTL